MKKLQITKCTVYVTFQKDLFTIIARNMIFILVFLYIQLLSWLKSDFVHKNEFGN